MILQEFIKRADKIHKNKYNYSNTIYKNNKTKVAILCSTHGVFYQRPHDHLRGCGCLECSGKKQLTTQKFIKKATKIHNNKYDYPKCKIITTPEFIKRAKQIHGNRYDYSKVKYKNARIKMLVLK